MESDDNEPSPSEGRLVIAYLVRMLEEIPRQARDDAEGRRVIYISRLDSSLRFASFKNDSGDRDFSHIDSEAFSHSCEKYGSALIDIAHTDDTHKTERFHKTFIFIKVFGDEFEKNLLQKVLLNNPYLN